MIQQIYPTRQEVDDQSTFNTVLL